MRRLLGQNKGAALVEFAFVSLLLLTLLMGIIECGLIITDYMCLNTGVRETLRQIAIPPASGPANTIIDKDTLWNNASTLDKNNITYVNQSYRVGAGNFVDGAPPEELDASTDIQLKVEAKYRCERLSSLVFDEPVVIGTHIVMKRE